MRNRLGRKPQGIKRKTPGTSKHSKAVGHKANIQIHQQLEFRMKVKNSLP